MQFSKKIFLGVFLSSILLGSIINWSAQRVVSQRAEENYLQRYSSLSKAIGRNLTDLERKTEILMRNAALAIAREDTGITPISDARLKTLRDEYQVTHAFVINSSGAFVRSTNEAASLIPNLFGFCSRYRNLVTGSESTLGTPIIPPVPEPLPYKFLTVPNPTRTRLIEVGMRVDFLADTLIAAMRDDPNLVKMSLYAPNGTPLGSFDKSGMIADEPVTATVADSGSLLIETHIPSYQPNCCQCEINGTSGAGDYFYTLKTSVSSSELATTMASIRTFFIGLQCLALFVSVLLGLWISRALGSRVRALASKVREIDESFIPDSAFNLKGRDEISFLGQEFDRMLGRLKTSQRKILESEKAIAVSDLASQVVHDIRSPVTSLELILRHGAAGLHVKERSVFQSALSDIKGLLSGLRAKTLDKSGEQALLIDRPLSPQSLLELTESAVNEKRAQFEDRPLIAIELRVEPNCHDLFSAIDPVKYRAILSNLMNNAIEALPLGRGRVVVVLERKGDRARVSVRDTGKGIPGSVITHLGERGYSFDKRDGTGLGLHSARKTVVAWGGTLSIASSEGKGADVSIMLPTVARPVETVSKIEVVDGGDLVIVDDDELVHGTWDMRLSHLRSDGTPVPPLVNLKSPTELRTWLKEAPEDVRRRATFLVDYEFAGSAENGLDLIESSKIAGQAVLVTGRSDERQIIERARRLRARVSPKTAEFCISFENKGGLQSRFLSSF